MLFWGTWDQAIHGGGVGEAGQEQLAVVIALVKAVLESTGRSLQLVAILEGTRTC